jgi:large subunit ribosomal protein L10
VRPERKYMIKELLQSLDKANFFFVTDYSKITVAQMTELRNQLRENKSVHHIFKNRLFKRIAKEKGYPQAMEKVLRGSSSFTIGGSDIVKVAKVLVDFSKKHNTFGIKAGVIDSKYMTKADIEKLASLPSREVLLAMVVGAIASPITGFVGVLHERVRSFVGVLAAIADKKRDNK